MQGNLNWAGVGIVVAAMVAVPSAPAFAQTNNSFSRTKNVAVRERPHPEYEPLGVRAGAFLVNPKLTTQVIHTDNLYGSNTNAKSASYLALTPSVMVKSNWARNEIALNASTEFDRYAKVSEENSASWQLGARGRLDVLRDANITGGASAGHFVEQRTASSNPTASIKPIQFDQRSAYLGATRAFNRVRLTGSANRDNFSYDDGRTAAGAVISQKFRERDITVMTGRADYALTPDTALFTKVTHNTNNFKTAVSGVDRDSKGAEFLVGANFQLTNVLRADIGVGWLKQDFKGAAFKDISGYSAGGTLEWFPTQITTVTLNTERKLQDSGLVGSAGALATHFGGQVDHELLRNLILTGSVGRDKLNFVGLDRDDKRTTFGASATYLLNRGLGLTAGLSRMEQSSKGLLKGGNFNVNKLSFGIVLVR
ncbi:outer membrane beta-barrel protein [Caulobacter sp.]|uniref:outer membrane beta-barrel protein n=1 Tax=Caulobacter sp. TaxID=78 RepID=UPI003D0A79C0